MFGAIFQFLIFLFDIISFYRIHKAACLRSVIHAGQSARHSAEFAGVGY